MYAPSAFQPIVLRKLEVWLQTDIDGVELWVGHHCVEAQLAVLEHGHLWNVRRHIVLLVGHGYWRSKDRRGV